MHLSSIILQDIRLVCLRTVEEVAYSTFVFIVRPLQDSVFLCLASPILLVFFIDIIAQIKFMKIPILS